MKEKFEYEDKVRFRKISQRYTKVKFDEHLFRKFFSVVNPSRWKGRIVLDIGCGEGIYVSKFAEEGSVIIGLDSSISVINIAKNNSQGAIFIRASATHLPIKEEVIDLCIIIGLLQHFPDKFVEKTISEANRVTHRDSVFIFDLKNSLNPFLYYRYKKNDSPDFTLKARSIKKIKSIINKHGFKINKRFTVPFPNRFAYLLGPLAPMFLLLCKKA